MATPGGHLPGTKQRRQRTILELVAAVPVGSQEELAERLRERGFEVTQATVSRDVAELGLVKAARGERHVYVAPGDTAAPNANDARLRRLLESIPVRIGRSGLTLVLTAIPGSAGAIAQAIDQSSLDEQVGTLAGDNTLLVLFETQAALERWVVRFGRFQPLDGDAWRPAFPAPGAAQPSGERSASHGHTPARPVVETSAGPALAHSEAPR